MKCPLCSSDAHVIRTIKKPDVERMVVRSYRCIRLSCGMRFDTNEHLNLFRLDCGVIKRDGSFTSFSVTKLETSIKQALLFSIPVGHILARVVHEISQLASDVTDRTVHTKDIHRLVVHELMNIGDVYAVRYVVMSEYGYDESLVSILDRYKK